MPVLRKETHKHLIEQLNDRIVRLQEAFAIRELTSNSEGIRGKGLWAYPEKMSATVGDKLTISMAINDFKTILTEIAKLK